MLYYHKDSYELKDLSNALVEAWINNNNPKINDWIEAPEKPGDEYEWCHGIWKKIIPLIPESISARQIRLWLIKNGISLDSIVNAINNIPDQILRESTLVEWEYAPYIERSHPMLVPLAQSLGLSESDVDRAFTEGSTL